MVIGRKQESSLLRHYLTYLTLLARTFLLTPSSLSPSGAARVVDGPPERLERALADVAAVPDQLREPPFPRRQFPHGRLLPAAA